jgi:DNA topoisomerase-2
MAIWSLTQERVEKLMRQIGDKEEEIDALIKLSPKDLWNIDLDAFVEEWNLQLTEEADRAKKIQRMGRRASHKLGIGASKGGKAKKKRKMGDSDSDDDSGSDFGPVKKKAKPKKEGLLSYLREADPPAKKTSPADSTKSALSSTAPQKQGSLLSHLVKSDVKKEAVPQIDGPSSPAEPEPAPAPVPAKKGRPAAAKPVKKPTPIVSDDEDDSDVFAVVAKEAEKKAAPKANGRAPRAATKPVSKYALDSDSDDDDDLLGDVSTMVKTIGGSSNGVPMFKSSTSVRPGSASGVPKVARKLSPSLIDIDDDDETNYEALLPQPSPKKPAPRNVNDTMLTSDSEDDFSLAKPKPAAGKLTAKPAPKAKPVPKAALKAKAPAAITKKPTVLSPAAKAYAARLEKASSVAKAAPKAKKPAVIDSDDEMEDADTLANEILSDEDEEPTPKPKAASRAPAARPGRRAAAKPAKYVVSDDDVESEEASEASFDDDSE